MSGIEIALIPVDYI